MAVLVGFYIICGYRSRDLRVSGDGEAREAGWSKIQSRVKDVAILLGWRQIRMVRSVRVVSL